MIHPLGSTAFAPSLSPYDLYIGAMHAPEESPTREVMEEYAADLAAIRALPVHYCAEAAL